MKSDIAYLSHIIESMKAVIEFTTGKTIEEFKNDRLVWSAVVRELEVIGEAVKNLSYRIREEYPEIPWRKMAGMRDVLSHGYFKINLDMVWETATVIIPDILPKIEDILSHLKRSP